MRESRITLHALNRYRERVGPAPETMQEARLWLFNRIFKEAKPRHLKRFLNNERKRTVMIVLSDCVLVSCKGWVVTVLTFEQFSRNSGWRPPDATPGLAGDAARQGETD